MWLLLKYTLLYASVLALVALGGMFSERSGIINIALEGIMVIGALMGVVAINIMNAAGVPVVLGVILGGAGVYEKLVEFAGAGATVPLTGFGNTLAKGVREAVQEQGILGALTGGLKASAAGIAAAVFFGFLAALVCSPKDKS